MKAFCCLLVMINISARTAVIPCDAQCRDQEHEHEHGVDTDTSEGNVQAIGTTEKTYQRDFETNIKSSKDLITESSSSPTTEHDRSLCDSTRVTNVYERDRDIDMRYVQDSITALWRIIFCLIFMLVLLVFLISYVSSVIRKHGEKKYSPKVNNHADKAGHSFDRGSQLYFPVINATRTANFLKDLDPIYDYPCSLQSDYERV